MPLTRNMGGAVRPVLNLFYVLDTSGSMQGDSIDTLNRAMIETIDAVAEEAAHNHNAQIKISVLDFNTDCAWVNPNAAESIEDFVWDDLAAGGMTYVGRALEELDTKLSRRGFLNSATGTLMPVIIFMTDGQANDDYDTPLKKIWQNKWFAKGTRIGFAIGKNPDTRMIAKLTGDSEAVIRTRDLATFAQLLRWASVSASTLASQTHTSEDTPGGGAVMNDVFDRHRSVDRTAVAPGFDYFYESEAATQVFDDFFQNEDDFYTTGPF